MSTERKITVYNTKGGQPKSFQSSAEKWGDLRNQIASEGFDVDKLLATESVTRRDLNNVEATLPEGDFIVFLRPKKTKSGDGSHQYGYKDAKNHIKDLIEKHGEHARAHFCDFKGKDYTHMSTAMLNEAISEYKAPEETSSASPVTQDQGEQMASADNGVGGVVESVAEAKKELSPAEKVDKAIELLKEVQDAAEEDSDDGDENAENVYERAEDLIGEVEAFKEDVLEWASPEAVAAKRAEEEEQQRLRDEASGLMGGFND